MSETKKPQIETFQASLDEFLFCGKEYPRDFSKLKDGHPWNDFFDAGAYGAIDAYQTDSTCDHMIVYHNNNPEEEIYMIGKIVEGLDEAPEGFKLMKFPAREFIVVTHNWGTLELSRNFGIGDCGKYANNVPIPNGYVRYDGPGSEIIIIEKGRCDSEKGHRWEWWVPIKKI